jgi:DNA-binding IclR family transcriptional regulator
MQTSQIEIRKETLSDGKKKYFFINSLAKGIKILELLSDNDTLSVTEIARLMNINRASSHRFLSTLRELGYVDQDENLKYRLEFKLLSLGIKLLDRFEIRKIAQPFLQELSSKFNETVNIGFFNGREMMTIDKIDSTQILRMDAAVGGAEPAYCTSFGKAILAYLPDRDLVEYLEITELKAYTPNTLTSKKMLREELMRIRKKGYSIDDEEFTIGLRCIGAPIFNHNGQAQFALSISGPAIRFDHKRIDSMQRELRIICGRLSEKLGYTLNAA